MGWRLAIWFACCGACASVAPPLPPPASPFAPRPALGRGWVEVEAVVDANDEEAPAHARARALQRARRLAAEQVNGVWVQRRFVHLRQEQGGAPIQLAGGT